MGIKPHTFELLNQKKHCEYLRTNYICKILFDIWVRTPKNSKFDAIMRYVIRGVGKSEAALKRIKNKIRSFYQTFEL